jgi:anaerobic magnesium-protoporphyrin IX monomethyl ester cyclase
MIDCFFIGYNSIPFRILKPILKLIRSLPFEKLYWLTGKISFVYTFHRNMNYNWVEYQNNIYSIPEIIALANKKDRRSPDILADTITENDGMSLTIAYLASFLQRRGFTFDFVNKFRSEKGALINRI